MTKYDVEISKELLGGFLTETEVRRFKSLKEAKKEFTKIVNSNTLNEDEYVDLKEVEIETWDDEEEIVDSYTLMSYGFHLAINDWQLETF